MCEDCANRDIRTKTTYVDSEKGILYEKYDKNLYPGLREQIAELDKRLSKLEKEIDIFQGNLVKGE